MTKLHTYACDDTPAHDPEPTSAAVPFKSSATVTLDMSEVIEARLYREDQIVWYRMRRANDMSRIKGRDAARMYREYRTFHNIVGQ